MTGADIAALSPFIVVAATAVAVMLAAAFRRNHALAAGLTSAGLTIALLALLVAKSVAPRQVTPLFVLDRFALFYTGLIFGAGVAVALLSYGYWKQRSGRPEEYYVLLLSATLGAAILTGSAHFVSFFMGLEILSISLYAMIAYSKTRAIGIEAGVKYLILAAGSASFLLFGMALVYAELGTMEFSRIAATRGLAAYADTRILLAGSAFMLVGIGFKLALAPFHWWTPDVYEGAPAPVTAFVATASKGAVFALLLRFFASVDIHEYPSLVLAFTCIAVASMFVGNLLALLQTNVKRILAYSSIAHLGYLLVAFLASGPWAAMAAAFYLFTYVITSLGGFGVITVLSPPERDADDLKDYRGLFWRRPGMATVFTVMLLSLAGIPLTAGFIGKFYLLAAGEQSARWLAVLALVVNSAIGLFYYLRIVVTMGLPVPDRDKSETLYGGLPQLPGAAVAVLAGLTVALVGIGLYPSPLLHLVQAFVTAPATMP